MILLVPIVIGIRTKGAHYWALFILYGHDIFAFLLMPFSFTKYFSFNTKAVSYAVRIFLGSVIVWWSLYYLHDNKKVWALISIIVVSDPDFVTLRSSIVSRTINTITGCILGLAFIFLLGVNIWSLMTAITLAVIFSTSFDLVNLVVVVNRLRALETQSLFNSILISVESSCQSEQ